MVSPEFHWNALGLGFVFIRVGEGAECQNYTIPVGLTRNSVIHLSPLSNGENISINIGTLAEDTRTS
jgi:hypothetical protein